MIQIIQVLNRETRLLNLRVVCRLHNIREAALRLHDLSVDEPAIKRREVTLTAIDGLPGVDIAACEKIARDLGVGFRRRVLGVVG